MRFIILFGLCLLGGNVLIALPFVDHELIAPWTEANARLAAGVLRLVGFSASATATTLSSPGATLAIRKGCDGVHALLILASAVLAFPASWIRRLSGVVLGVVAIFGLNALRLLSLLVIAVRFPAQLEFFHVYVWQVLICLLAFGTFLVWGTFLAGRR